MRGERGERTIRVGAALVALLGAAAIDGCLPSPNTERYVSQTDDDAGGPPPITLDGGDGIGDAPALTPHALLGVDPPHGPFSGGTLVTLRGNGFASDARVWFGDTEVDPELVLVLDPQRVQVTSPAAEPGPTDVIIQNGNDESTRAELPGGFTFDDFYLEPSSGPTSGGTRVTVRSSAPLFGPDVEIEIDLSPCEIEEILSDTELVCRAPAGTPGAKRVRVETEDGTSIDVLDGFTYVVSDNGFRGGLSGEPLDGTVEVLVLNDLTGDAVAGATVIAGDDSASALTAATDSFGTATLSSAELGSTVTVTVAAPCLQPITFVDVPVDRVTAYLLPVLSPDCGSGGDIPGGGGNPGRGTSVSGELIWGLGGEFRREGFKNVPTPSSPTEHQVAYVFRLASQPTTTFSLPSAVTAVTPSSPGEVGYSFYFSTSPGNFTLYALAGLEDRAEYPYHFTPYALGLTRGVVGAASSARSDVFIEIDVPLDHSLAIDATGPVPTPRGPDRIVGTLAIEVGGEGYVLLPNGRQTGPLPAAGPLDFVGVPPLWGSLTGGRYVASARAVTGAAGGVPLSAVGLFATTSEGTLGVGAFLEIPRLVSPASSTTWNGTELELAREPGGPAADLTIADVVSGSGLVTWRIVAPGQPERVRVPDLREFGSDIGLISGPLVIGVTAARVDSFSYGALRYRELAERGWRAHAQDAFFSNY